VAVTVTEEPTASEQPEGQLGETEPDPEETPVVKVCLLVVAPLLSVKTIWPLLYEKQEPKLRLLVSPVYPVFTHYGTITFPLGSLKVFETLIDVPELNCACEPPP